MHSEIYVFHICVNDEIDDQHQAKQIYMQLHFWLPDDFDSWLPALFLTYLKGFIYVC